MEICKKEISSFDDLVFGVHPGGQGLVASMHELPNGVIISVIGGFPTEHQPRLGGDGIHTFEVAAWHKEGHEWIQLSENDDILYYQNRNEITDLIQRLLKV